MGRQGGSRGPLHRCLLSPQGAGVGAGTASGAPGPPALLPRTAGDRRLAGRGLGFYPSAGRVGDKASKTSAKVPLKAGPVVPAVCVTGWIDGVGGDGVGGGRGSLARPGQGQPCSPGPQINVSPINAAEGPAVMSGATVPLLSGSGWPGLGRGPARAAGRAEGAWDFLGEEKGEAPRARPPCGLDPRRPSFKIPF